MRRPRAPRSRPAPTTLAFVSATLGAALLAGCGSPHPAAAPGSTTTATFRSATTTATIAATTTAVAPSTTLAPIVAARTTTTTPVDPPFRSAVEEISAADLPSTYRPGCPVGPAQLRRLRVTYWGFDARAHTGTIVVAASVATTVVRVFSTLYGDRFPIRAMQPEDAFGGHDPDSMTADNTSGFNCRNAVATGAPHWSAHAYGTAIDVNPVENPYLEGGVVQPANGAAFVDRSQLRPGMAGPGSVLNQAFAAVGWQWGGRWASSPDYQHFSANGG